MKKYAYRIDVWNCGRLIASHRICADTEERKTAMQVNFERVRFEQEKICRHIRARIDELKRVAKVDILKATNERDNLNRQLAGQMTEKYNAKVRSLKDEEVCI